MRPQRPSARASSIPPSATPRVTRSGLQLGDRAVPLYSGALHYFRMPPSRWRRALESLRWLGLTFVESYVPWGVHEIAEGRFDFGGDDPRKDLGAFLDLAKELGLYVHLRPGPHVNAELPYFGLPRRVVMDERNQARSSRGHVLPLPAPPRFFPVPSYASRHFRGEVERWFAALAPIVAKRRWPDGPVALVQVDNEAAFYFRDAPYDVDYHPDALADFAVFLARRHGSIDALNRAYGTRYGRFEDVPAPRRFDAQAEQPLPPCLDWMRFHDALLCDALADLRRGLAGGFAGLPVTHNLPMGESGLPVSLTSIGRSADLVGLDYYHLRSGVESVRKRTQKLAGSTKLAFAPELGVGAPPWFAPRAELDSLLAMLWALAYGLRAFNLYMAVDREQWYGALLDADGEPRPQAERFRRLLSALQRTRWSTLQRKAEVAISLPKEYAHLSRATHALGALSPSLFDLAGMPISSASRQDRFGFQQPIQIAWEPWIARIDQALCAAQVPFTYVEGEADLAAQTQLRAVIAPCFEFADPERWQRLREFEQRGGRVLIGPTAPERNLDLLPHAFPELAAARTPLPVHDLAEAEALARTLQAELGLTPAFPVFPQPLHASVHEDAEGPRVVFVLNPTSEERTAELGLPRPLAFEDAMSGERLQGSESIAVPLAAWGCRMLIVEGGA